MILRPTLPVTELRPGDRLLVLRPWPDVDLLPALPLILAVEHQPEGGALVTVQGHNRPVTIPAATEVVVERVSPPI